MTHDFEFEIKNKVQEVFCSLTFQKTKVRHVCPVWKSKISFHSNQGRNLYLLWGVPLLSSKRNYTFVVEDIIKFYWTEGSKHIRYTYLQKADSRLVHYWLLHTFLPLYYELESIYDMFHAGSVEINGKACLFAAPSFGGKSTLTHYFLQKGHTIFSDDKLGLYRHNDSYCAIPSYPYVRNYREMENLGEYTEKLSEKMLPIGCIFSLKLVEATEKIIIRKLRGVEKFSVVEMSSDIKLSILNRQKFFHLQDITEHLTIYEITIPNNLERLAEVYDQILSCFTNMID